LYSFRLPPPYNVVFLNSYNLRPTSHPNVSDVRHSARIAPIGREVFPELIQFHLLFFSPSLNAWELSILLFLPLPFPYKVTFFDAYYWVPLPVADPPPFRGIPPGASSCRNSFFLSPDPTRFPFLGLIDGLPKLLTVLHARRICSGFAVLCVRRILASITQVFS